MLLAAHGLAGFGAAHLQNMASGRGAAKIVIEADDAVHFGVRKIERAGDQRNRGLIDVAELFLQCVQNRQQGAGQALQFLDAR